MAAVLVAPVIALVGLVLAAEPAVAATTTATYTLNFSPPGQSEVSCTISIRADFPFGGAHTGRAVTTTSGTSSACTTNVTTMTGAEYRDTNGDFITEPNTASFAATRQQTYNNVARDFQTYHQVYYAACGCATQVYVLSTVNPK